MSPFPFLKLPQLAQKVVVNQIDFTYAIRLSMLSKKFEKVLKQVKITVKKFDYKFGSGFFVLIISTLSDTLYISSEFLCDDRGAKWNIDGNDIRVVRDVLCYAFRIRVKCKDDTDESLDTLEIVTKHLLSFLKVKKFELTIHGKIDIPKLFIWKYKERFHAIYCRNGIRSADLSPDGLKFVLEDVQTDFLSLDVKTKTDMNFKYHPQNQVLSKIRKIEINNSRWVNYDSLLNMANESITCYNPRLFCENLNRILSATSSAFTKDEIEKRTNLDKSIILTRQYNTMDIQREHDGCKATLVFSRNQLILLVWNKKHLKSIGRM